MDTLSALLADPSILRIEVSLGPRDLPVRRVFGTRAFVDWLEQRRAGMEKSKLGIDLSITEQIDSLFYRFIVGDVLRNRWDFRCVKIEKYPVWEMKTPDIRIFGWFPEKDCFIAVCGGWADHIKDYDLYRGYRLEIRRLRRTMNLARDLCGRGTTPDDVISH
ncbi:hypothetical protein [Methylobacterium aerolatum]|uniref:Uncharacterized protein n=1 Tax=Methylobacterium aerolatum TaxID=418708 RepID=A0ABU0HUS9_9HYPH|nr:hypothetical protein [Methylobacterium aerolatum]MDQ0446088.1 hypothetical protein [Methylobacterium aerolatum]GJD35124.1 hypothetical protein FMGBMHLM_2032 [Methylobacterium aerolatum]